MQQETPCVRVSSSSIADLQTGQRQCGRDTSWQVSKAPGTFAILVRRFLTTLVFLLFLWLAVAVLGRLAFHKPRSNDAGHTTILLTCIQLDTIVTRYATRVNKTLGLARALWHFGSFVVAGNPRCVAVQIYTWINANDELSSIEFVTGGETALPNRSAHLIVST